MFLTRYLLTIESNTESLEKDPSESVYLSFINPLGSDVSDDQRSSLTVHLESVSKCHITVKHIDVLIIYFSYPFKPLTEA